MHPSFKTVPVGTDGLHAVQRTHDGIVSYLAQRTDSSRIGSWSLGLAEATVKVFENSKPQGEDSDYHWLPWHTDHLNTKRPASMYPPTRSPSTV